jgi:fructosamine-3-kinase
VLPGLLAGCEAEHLQQQALAVCRWAMQSSIPEVLAELQRIAAHLREAQTFFHQLAEQLTDLPSTVVHGDFWSGNIAVAGQELRFIDWGNALWGVGGVSLVILIATSEGQLDEAEAAIWHAYEQGWERPIRQGYREACQVASIVADLVIDTAIATSCGRGPKRLPGLLPGLRELEALVTRQASG